MLQQLDTYFGDVRLTSIIEIVIVAVFFFFSLSWFRLAVSRRAARIALVTIFLYGAAYFAARFYGLYFVELVIERAFILFLITMVVVFQTEIHRLIARVGTWRPFSRIPPDRSAGTVPQTLTEASFAMAERHVGALIAVRGRESWEGHIEGGVELDGRPSLPLLYSIFDPDTPGHDGAVLIDGDRVTRFGVHLPLSSRLPKFSRFGGTRHAAAQGLSEVTDALVIVVSEEQGTVSLAEKGNLEVIQTPIELQRRLENFWSAHYGPASKQKAVLPYQNLTTAVLSLVLSILLWASLMAYESGTVFRTYFVPIELRGLPDTLRTSGPEPSHVHITLTGTSGAFRALNVAELRIIVDMDQAVSGTNVVQITQDNVQVPSNLRVYEIEPQIITVRTQPALRPTTHNQVRPVRPAAFVH